MWVLIKYLKRWTALEGERGSRIFNVSYSINSHESAGEETPGGFKGGDWGAELGDIHQMGGTLSRGERGLGWPESGTRKRRPPSYGSNQWPRRPRGGSPPERRHTHFPHKKEGFRYGPERANVAPPQPLRELRPTGRCKLVVRALPHALLLAAVPGGALGLGRTQEGLQGNRAGAQRHEP